MMLGYAYRVPTKLESVDFLVAAGATAAVLPVDDYAVEIFVQPLDGDIEIDNSGANASLKVTNGQTAILDNVAATLVLRNDTAADVNVKVTRRTLR